MEINAGIETILATKENDVKEKVEQIIGLDDKTILSNYNFTTR